MILDKWRFCYLPVDVFICMECQRLISRKRGWSYQVGHSVPHCTCTGEPIKMGFIDSMPASSFEHRKMLIERNWKAFLNGEGQGRYPRKKLDRFKNEAAIRAAYELGVI